MSTVTPTASAAAYVDPLPRPWRVRATVRETLDVVTLELSPDGTSDATFAPGQFNMLYAFGVGEVPISFSGGTCDHIAHTIRAVGPVSSALSATAPGDVIGVRGPFGTPWPSAEQRGRDIVIAAGGIGLAPLRPVLEYVCAQRDTYHNVVLLYGMRKPEDQLFGRDYARWRARDIQIEETVDHADAAWTGHVGVVTTLIRRARFAAATTTAFLCGPEIMMRMTARELVRAGVAESDIYVSLERNMQCAVGFCGHCQLGPTFVCRDGPVFAWPRVRQLIAIREL
jgi:NAD(P)H-flavin reductase